MIDLSAIKGRVIPLGVQGENKARRVAFDTKSYVQQFGSGTAVVFYKPKDRDAYPVPLEPGDGVVYWVITSADTLYPGYGQVEFRWYGYDGELLGKPVRFDTNIITSIVNDGNIGEQPDNMELWMDSMLAVGTQVSNQIDRRMEEFDAYYNDKKDELKGDPFTFEDFTDEQLSSLKGEKGEPFKFSDFTQAQLEALRGYKGDPFYFEDFTPEQLKLLKGEKGDPFIYTDFTPEQLAKLKGEKGDAFTFSDLTPSQIKSLKGDKGEPFRYEDFTYEQLEELKGAKGDPFRFEDFTPEQLALLKGEPGASGEDSYAREEIEKLKHSLFTVDEDGYISIERGDA